MLFDNQDERIHVVQLQVSCIVVSLILTLPQTPRGLRSCPPLLAAVSVVLSAPVVLPTIDRFVLQFFEQTNLWDWLLRFRRVPHCSVLARDVVLAKRIAPVR